MILIQGRSQKRRIQIPLDGTHSTGALVPPLGKRLFDVPSASVAKLTELGLSGRNFDEDAARTRNGALELCYKHPWCSKSHTSAVLFLPAFIGKLFEDDRVPHGHNLMDFATMQALGMRSQFAFFLRLTPPDLLVALALLPGEWLLSTRFLDATPAIIVARIGCSPLPIHFALQATNALLIGNQLLAEDG
jgi:hypothetical protein